MIDQTSCQIKGCDKATRSRTSPWCEMHYYRNRRHGNPGTRLLKTVSFNKQIFRNMNEDAAWLLGLLWSDGNLSGRVVSLVSLDEQLILDAAKILSLSNGIYRRRNPLAFVMQFTSCEISEALRSFGMAEAKSLTIGWPREIPAYLNWAFVRGVFDGDGCVYVNEKVRDRKCDSCAINWTSGSEAFARPLLGFLKDAGCDPGLGVRHNPWGTTTYIVRVLSRRGILIAKEGMYPSSEVPCLHRKRDKLREWLQRPRPKVGGPKKPLQACVLCGNPRSKLGFCNTHYLRFKRYGDPLAKHDRHGRLITHVAS